MTFRGSSNSVRSWESCQFDMLICTIPYTYQSLDFIVNWPKNLQVEGATLNFGCKWSHLIPFMTRMKITLLSATRVGTTGTIGKRFISQWRHNDRYGVSLHKILDCLLNLLCRSKKTSKLCVSGLWGNPTVTVVGKMFPFDYVIRQKCHQNIGISSSHEDIS